MNIFYALWCLACGSMFFVAAIHGLRKNYRVTHDSDYIIVEGVRVSSFTSNGRIPMVKMDYKGEVIVRTLDSTAFKEGEKVSVYYNPNRKEESLRAVGKIDNLKYIIVLIISLPIYGAAFLFAFPNLII